MNWSLEISNSGPGLFFHTIIRVHIVRLKYVCPNLVANWSFFHFYFFLSSLWILLINDYLKLRTHIFWILKNIYIQNERLQLYSCIFSSPLSYMKPPTFVTLWQFYPYFVQFVWAWTWYGWHLIVAW